MTRRCRLWPALLLAVAGQLQAQVTVRLPATRDASIFEDATGNANGGADGVFAGVNNNGFERRALLAFDQLTIIPANAQILSASLELNVTRTQGPPTAMQLHRINAAWNEGSSTSSGGNGGMASSGDVTWLSSNFPDQPWTNPGGDFESAAVASASVNEGMAIFPAQQELIDTVAAWLTDPASNHGLLLRNTDTTQTQTSRRFASREAASGGPVLELTVAGQSLAISGLWFDPAREGEGFNIIQAQAGITVFFFGYDATGQRLWLVSETLQAPVFVDHPITLAVFSGPVTGSLQNPPPSSELLDWGLLTMTFSTCTTATIALSGIDGEKTSSAIALAGIDNNPCPVPVR